MALEDVTIRREVVLPVDRQTVWAAFADPGELATWLADDVELAIEPGARGWLGWEGGERRRVTVEEVVEQRRIVLRWCESDGPETLVELVLDDAPEGTRLIVLEVPVVELQVAETLLEEGMRVVGGSGSGARGPQMVAALA